MTEMRLLARYLLLATFNLATLSFAYWAITDLRWEWIAWLLLWLPWMLACNLVLRKAI
jgi:hypothetical protein